MLGEPLMLVPPLECSPKQSPPICFADFCLSGMMPVCPSGQSASRPKNSILVRILAFRLRTWECAGVAVLRWIPNRMR